MSDYRTMFDNEFLGSWDLDGRDVTLTISRVVAKTIAGDGGKSDRKPVAYFRRADGSESPKGLVVNKTNGRTIASLYGTKVESWVGKRITLYPTTTTVGRETRECIRVRPVVPQETTKTTTQETSQ